MTAPSLETPRLRLRPHRGEDLDALAEMWGDPLVTRFIGGVPATRAQSWTRLLSYAGHWSLMGYGYWAIEEKASGLYVGDVGLADFKRGLGADFDGSPEAGWAISPRFWGRGVAREAVTRAIEWGFETLQTLQVTCMISPENTASMKVAAACGFRFERDAVFNEKPVRLYTASRTRPSATNAARSCE